MFPISSLFFFFFACLVSPVLVALVSPLLACQTRDLFPRGSQPRIPSPATNTCEPTPLYHAPPSHAIPHGIAPLPQFTHGVHLSIRHWLLFLCIFACRLLLPAEPSHSRLACALPALQQTTLRQSLRCRPSPACCRSDTPAKTRTSRRAILAAVPICIAYTTLGH